MHEDKPRLVRGLTDELTSASPCKVNYPKCIEENMTVHIDTTELAKPWNAMDAQIIHGIIAKISEYRQ